MNVYKIFKVLVAFAIVVMPTTSFALGNGEFRPLKRAAKVCRSIGNGGVAQAAGNVVGRSVQVARRYETTRYETTEPVTTSYGSNGGYASTASHGGYNQPPPRKVNPAKVLSPAKAVYQKVRPKQKYDCSSGVCLPLSVVAPSPCDPLIAADRSETSPLVVVAKSHAAQPLIIAMR